MARKDNSDDDEKITEDESLDAESEEPTRPNAFIDSEDEDEDEEDTSWREVRHLELEKPESLPDLELETPLDQIGDQEVVDDPVRMYLHEIGRVSLLTATEAKDLARKMEEGRRIRQIRHDYRAQQETEPSATDIILAILHELAQASSVINLLGEHLELPPGISFLEKIYNNKLRDSIDSEISPNLILAVAHHSQKSIAETELFLTELSLNINLLPQEVLDALGEKVSAAGIENLVNDPGFVSEIQAYEPQLQAYLDNIEFEAEMSSNHLIEANLRLVVSVAKKHIGRGMSLLDLIQEGNIGLMHAIKKFDPYRGIKLSYYASFWIKAYILKFIMDNWKLVKIGTTQSQRKLFYNLKREKEKLRAQGFEPGPKLLAEALNVREEEVIEMDQRLGGWELSLDAPLKDGSDEYHKNFLPTTEPQVEDVLADAELKDMFRRKLREFRAELNDKELDILDLRLLAEKPLTLQEIGVRHHISRERVRQIEREVMAKLRHGERADRLRSYAS